MAVWTVSAILLFDQNLALPLLIPLGTGLATFVLVLGMRFVFLDKDRRFLRKGVHFNGADNRSVGMIELLNVGGSSPEQRSRRRTAAYVSQHVGGNAQPAE